MGAEARPAPAWLETTVRHNCLSRWGCAPSPWACQHVFDDLFRPPFAPSSSVPSRTATCWVAEAAARDLPQVSLEDALKLVHLYAEKESPKYEAAAMKWLSRYLKESSPLLTTSRSSLQLSLGARSSGSHCVEGIRAAPTYRCGESPCRARGCPRERSRTSADSSTDQLSGETLAESWLYYKKRG